MIVNRIRRLYQSLNPENSPSDIALIEFFLPVPLAALFFSMAEMDQKHCLATAKTALKIAQTTGRQVDQKLLFQAALLHDVGRRKGDMTVRQRLAAVLLDACLPGWARKLAGRAKPRGSLSYAMYIYYNHPAHGAHLIRQAGGGEALSNLAALHHSRHKGPPELIVLREADALN